MKAVTRSVRRSEGLPAYVRHASFGRAAAAKEFDPKPLLADPLDTAAPYMPDDATRDHARRMHYAAHRMHEAQSGAERRSWLRKYLALRDRIVLGNRKLVYRAVRRRNGASNYTDDLVGDCQIVLIQAVAVYNPWIGVRFSTYAYTCIVRALARKARRSHADRLAQALPLDAFGDPTNDVTERASDGTLRLEDYLRADHPLLDDREKCILSKRYVFDGKARIPTLERVGREMGLSKERVRQVQSGALEKLRRALTCEVG